MTGIIQLERREPLSIKIQTLATVISIVAAVVVPQFFHWLGAVSGSGTAPGIAFSPMHLPIIIVGFLAGPFAGGISGLLGPVAAFLISGMPTMAQLPFMMVELFGYGLAAGLLRNVKMNLVLKTLLVMVAGRVLRMGACTFAFYALGNANMAPLGIWRSIPSSLPGIVLQIVMIPLIVFWVENKAKEQKK
ncbi:MAG: ECF transporter S component [Treponemataceae bacterium]|nr:ECF transporter S component [Treponemataceae bacterium]